MKTLFLSALVCCMLLSSCSKAEEDVSLFSEADIEVISTEVTYSKIENEILSLVNEYRLENNLSSLEILNIISSVADEHTNYMIETGDISHAHFGERAAKLMKSTGATQVSENVAFGYSSAKSVLNGWLNSPEHKKTIENPSITHFGVSSRTNEEGRNYFTQIFIEK